ncbi:unnamed protein product [Heligmosomoides polygyrus]|uniref:APP_amyloid domain-containing protein n=1 Tax=Heligmosomoides polygyrus TaxID=6339 RepID=A0A183FVR7_HELPZ|nr:unnamed protein product [Heligmosomoides polygyrus]
MKSDENLESDVSTDDESDWDHCDEEGEENSSTTHENFVHFDTTTVIVNRLHLVLVMIAVISTAVAMMCYFHRKKARYHAVDDLSLSLEKSSSDEQEGASLPPSYDDVVPKTRSTEIVATSDGKFATLLVTTSEDKQQHLHV